jgi:hypothetical protein
MTIEATSSSPPPGGSPSAAVGTTSGGEKKEGQVPIIQLWSNCAGVCALTTYPRHLTCCINALIAFRMRARLLIRFVFI